LFTFLVHYLLVTCCTRSSHIP